MLMKQNERVKRLKGDTAVTLQDVAELAGVHPMTVSNALKGTGRVSAATRANIQRIAEDLNYTPNAAARALVTGKTGSIAVVTGPVSEHFYAHLLHLLEIELSASNYKMLFLRSRDLNRDLMSTVRNSAVDGVLVIDAFLTISSLVQPDTGRIPPYVYAGVLDPHVASTLPLDSIKMDLSQGVYDAVRAMVDSGCRRIAYLVSNQGMAQLSEVRPRVYEETMEEADLTREIINLEIGSDTSTRDLVRRRLTDYIVSHGCPEGLLCQNDEMAIAAYRALRDLGLKIPEDVQLVGCDGLLDMEYFDPQLSTIVQPVEQMCALAWQFLQNRMADSNLPRQQATLEAHFKARPSVKMVPLLQATQLTKTS
jgi:DNA-binding LacI/PurR family transcriptional regulator